MAQKATVDALMKEHNISRTMANNMLRSRVNGLKDKFGNKITKRRAVDPKTTDVAEYRKNRKNVIKNHSKTTKTIRRHKTSRVKNVDTAPKKSK